MRHLTIAIFAAALSWLFNLCSVQAQEPIWNVKRFATEEGLLDPQVLSIQQHSNGVLYCNTAKGIFFNEGAGFQSLPIRQLAYRTLSAFGISKKGELFLFVRNQGLYAYNASTQGMELLLANKDLQPTDLFVTPQWIFLFTRGIRMACYERKTGQLIKDEWQAKEKNNLAYAACLVSDTLMLVGRKDGIYQFVNGHFLPVLPTKEAVTAINAFQSKIFYKLENTVFQWDMRSNPKLKEKLKFNISDLSTLSNGASSEMLLPDNRGGYWYVTENASELWNKQSTGFKPCLNRLGIPQGIINCLFRDAAGNLWIGMGGQGLYVIWNSLFNNFTPATSELSLRYLNAHHQNGTWFIGTSNGVVLTNPKADAWIRAGHEDAYFKKPVQYIASDSKGLRFSSLHGPEDLQYKTLSFDSKKLSYQFDRSEKWIVQQQVKYTAAAFGCVLKTEAGKTDTILNLPGFETRILDLIWFENSLFIATSKGLYVWKQGQPQALAVEGPWNQWTVFNFCDLGTDLLIAHEAGLSRWKSKSIQRFKPKNITVAIHKVISVHHTWYLATQNGIYITDSTGYIRHHLQQSEGLPSDYIADLDLMQNQLLAISPSAVSFLELKDLQKNPYQSAPLTLKYRISGKPLWHAVLGPVILNATEKRIEWQGIWPEFHPKQNLIFKWRLDQEPSFESNGTKTELFIPAGQHRLELCVQLKNGSWSKPFRVEVIRKPDWSEHAAFPILLTLLGMGLFAALGIGIWRYQRRLSRKRLNEEQTLNRLKHRAMNALLSPHFIFNSLTSIQHYINENNKRKASEYLAKFSRLIRMILERASQSEIQLNDEITRLKVYLDLEKERFNDKFTYTLEVDPQVDPNAIAIPNMIVQPHIENALLHGILPKSGSGHVHIHMFKKQGCLWIQIQDNGVGIESLKQTKTHVSIAADTIEHILTLNTKLSGKTQQVTRQFLGDHQNEGTRIEIKIEL